MRLRANAICQREDVMFVWDLNSNLVEGMHEENTDIFDFYAYDGVLNSNKIIKGKYNEQYQNDHTLPST